MNRYFECGIRYEKLLENGMQKKVTEQYIVDALSFTEAEQRITKEMGCYINGDFEVVTEKITNYSEVIPSDNAEADRWYKVKINIVTIDERRNKEKKNAVYLYYLIQAKDIDDARPHDKQVHGRKRAGLGLRGRAGNKGDGRVLLCSIRADKFTTDEPRLKESREGFCR